MLCHGSTFSSTAIKNLVPGDHTKGARFMVKPFFEISPAFTLIINQIDLAFIASTMLRTPSA
jgi:hypothetical protein